MTKKTMDIQGSTAIRLAAKLSALHELLNLANISASRISGKISGIEETLDVLGIEWGYEFDDNENVVTAIVNGKQSPVIQRG